MQAPFADPLLGLERLRTPLPLVGRDTELQILRMLMQTVVLDLPVGQRALTISGEMGVGKTRLLATLCSEAKASGFLVLEASAYESGSLFPYMPFIDALRPLVHGSSLEQLRRYTGLERFLSAAGVDRQDDAHNGVSLQRVDTEQSVAGKLVVAGLGQLFPELPMLLRVDPPRPELLAPHQEMLRVHDAVATLLGHVSREQPVLVCIDSIQWADSASLMLMLYLTRRLHTSRVLLVGAARPSFMTPSYAMSGLSDSDALLSRATSEAAKLIESLMTEGVLLFLPLAPLSQEAAERHVHGLLPGRVPPTVVQALLERAEGNPFFLEELVRTQTLNRQLVLQDGEWKIARVGSTQLPDSIRLAVVQRLSSVSEGCHRVLRIASLFGRSFPQDALMRVLRSSLQEVQPLIDEARQASLIAELPQSSESLFDNLWEEEDELIFQEDAPELSLPRYIFCQGIVQEALQADTPSYMARSLHSSIGKALEESYRQEAGEHAAELARHYALGGEREATLRWSLVAGEDAVRKQAYREAVRHYSLVLKLLDGYEVKEGSRQEKLMPLTLPTPIELNVTIGELWLMMGELELAAKAFQQALAQLHQIPDPPSLMVARVNRLLADAYRLLVRYDLAVAHLQVAMNVLDDIAKSHPSAGQPVKQISHISWYPGRTSYSSTVEMGTATVNAAERMLLLESQVWMHIMLRHPQEAEIALRQLQQLATERGDRSNQAFAMHMMGYQRGWGEQVYEAIRLLEQAHELYLEIGDPYRAILSEQVLGTFYLALGEVEKSHYHTLRGIEMTRRYGNVRGVLSLGYLNKGIIALFRGAWDECEAQLQLAIEDAQASKEMRQMPLGTVAKAMYYLRREDWQHAEPLFIESVRTSSQTEWYPSVVAFYGYFLAISERRAAAREQLDLAAATIEPVGPAGSYYIPFLAEGYLRLNDLERAESYLERIRALRGFMYYGYTVDRVLGMITARRGDYETADAAFEAGLAMCRRVGNAPEEGNILYEQAQMALMHGDALERVYSLCGRARVIFEQYDMQRALKMVETLEEGARELAVQDAHAHKTNAVAATVSSKIPGRNNREILEQHLTKRELEVLRLVASGYTDRQVADFLIISPRTANRHLSNILTKLAVSGRAAAVAYAIRMGLV